MYKEIAVGLMGGLGVISTAVLILVRQVLAELHGNVGIRTPTKNQMEEENFEVSAIMRKFPELKHRLAFRSLGNNFPTPIHRGECTYKDTECKFFVKREDLCSIDRYGGNKVRTLQHQLGVVEARVKREGLKRLVVVGSGGSNQIVATIVHVNALNSKPSVSASWIAKDPSNLDNSMNMLSSLSFSSLRADESNTWAHPIKMLLQIASALYSSNGMVLPMGGNSPAGVIGQISACLELAEQIERGQCDPPAIYLAVGSSCTISGLIIGVALARRLNMKAFRSPRFRIHGIPIHHALATLQRSVNFLKSKLFGWLPLTTRHTIISTCDVLEKLLPNSNVINGLKEDSLRVMEYELEFRAERSMIGTYGGHSDMSRSFSEMYDRTGKIFDNKNQRAEHIWLCGHFTAKAFGVMIQDIQNAHSTGRHDYCPLFWQTKSALQPRGDRDEFELAKSTMPSKIQRWINRGEQDSTLRPGSIDLNKEKVTTYRDLMVRSKL